MTANEFELQKVPAGYIISEELAESIFEGYPRLKDIFENAIKIESGYYMDDYTTIELGNRLSELRADLEKEKAEKQAYKLALEEERTLFDEVRESDKRIIELQEIQISDYKKLYKESSTLSAQEKIKYAAGGAGIVAVLLLLAGIEN